MEDTLQTPSRRKSIIALRHSTLRGKTQTLRALADLIVLTFPDLTILEQSPLPFPGDGDIRLVVDIGGIIVAIESGGDPKTDLRLRLEELAAPNQFDADLIFCSSRTSGETWWAVVNTAESHHYEIIWSSTYETLRDVDLANETKARHLLDLAHTLGILP